jgi:hypothetical protein
VIWLVIVHLLGLVAFIALGVEDSRHHRALRAPDQS